jgi:tRNA-specific 2-thiouridylase
VLDRHQLRHAMFPLGDTVKTAVRAEAAARGLALAGKPDSHDICFIADGDTAGFLRDRLGARPGRIVEPDGSVLGSHEGAYGFTVGQRRGLRIGTPAADGRPRYVLDISPATATVVVGPAEGLDVHLLRCGDPRWCGMPPEDGEFDCLVQIRAHGAVTPAVVAVSGEVVEVRLGESIRGVAPGQAAVFYLGTQVLGSATIAATG